MKKRLNTTLVGAIAVVFATHAAAAHVPGPPCADAGDALQIDAALIYAVSLAESARGQSGQRVAPHPYTLRVADQPGFYASTLEEAHEHLSTLLESHRSIDICLMQVNTRWNGHRVNSPHDLLDIKTCIFTGAEILREAIDSAPGDLALGIGRYYNWNDEAAARNYGNRVLSFYQNLPLGW